MGGITTLYNLKKNMNGFIYQIPYLGKRYLHKRVIKEGGTQESTTLRNYVQERYRVCVGLYTYGSVFDNDFNIGGTMVEVGRYCSFASGVNYYGANHPYHFFSTSPYFYNKAFGNDVEDIERFNLTIGNDVWVGAGTIITCGCKSIGNGAVIGAGSVVTKDVPAYSIVAGVPARIIKKRFDDETIQLLEESQWFNFSPSQLMMFYQYRDNPREFAKQVIRYSQNN